MAGPEPKYTPEQRKEQGNPGRRPADEITPLQSIAPPLDYVPDPPDWLFGENETDTSALAVNAWRSICPLLIDARAFREGDEFALARYCRYLAEWVQATNDIDLRGLTLSSVRGEQRNPSLLARQSIEQSLEALEKELGLSPRARVEVQKRLMSALKDLPLAGNNSNTCKKRGPVGFLNVDKEDE